MPAAGSLALDNRHSARRAGNGLRAQLGLLSGALARTLRLGVERHLGPLLLAGLLANIAPAHPPLASAEAMAISGAVALLLDPEARRKLTGPLDRADHAALLVLIACALDLLNRLILLL